MSRVVDLFAGPGGWDVAAVELGLDPLGVEWDDAACRVREAAGLRTLQADVSELDPLDFPCDLLIASPPCTAFSMAGKGEGRKAMDTLLACIDRMADGEPVDALELDRVCDDETAHLVLEPLRWTLALEPGMVCCEQVPPALPIWQAMEPVLRARGYHTWSGVLSAETFGVPQTRKRAFLIASRFGPVGPPAPTHARYVAPQNRDDDGGGLFALPEPERVVLPEDRGLLPWVSMADALGWGMTARPYPAVASSRTTGGPDKEKVGGSGARDVIYGEQAAGRWQMRANAQANAAVRQVDEPAPTITAGHDSGERVWVTERPSTTVAADPRIPEPGWRGSPDDYDADGNYTGKRSTDNAVRVTEAQAARLQGFPDNYPWHAAGSRSAAFRCIGNAVPPPLAAAVLAEALATTAQQENAA